MKLVKISGYTAPSKTAKFLSQKKGRKAYTLIPTQIQELVLKMGGEA